jgi:hypothetical protein
MERYDTTPVCFGREKSLFFYFRLCTVCSVWGWGVWLGLYVSLGSRLQRLVLRTEVELFAGTAKTAIVKEVPKCALI